jgi:hypothetical protein
VPNSETLTPAYGDASTGKSRIVDIGFHVALTQSEDMQSSGTS